MKTFLKALAALALTMVAVLVLPDLMGAHDGVLAAAAGGFLFGGEDLVKRGITHVRHMRPALTANMDPYAVNATLRHEEWRMVDERVNRVLRERLTIADDLRSRGLVEPLSLGTLIRTTERLEEFGEAEISYDGDTSPKRDRPSFLADNIPVPVIAKDFQINWRQLIASRERGEPLDFTAAEAAARRVRDKLQSLFTNGATGGPTGTGIPGLTNAAHRITVSLTYNWDADSADIIADVESMLAAAYAKNLFGPFVLYVPKNYWATIQGDYSSQKGDRTYMERILAFNEIEAVRPLDSLSDDNVVMVQMTRDAIDLSEAQAVTTVQWDKNPFVTNFRVLMVGGPHIKSMETADGDTVHGIVHLS